MSYRTFSQVMYRVENVYRLLPPDFFKGNYESAYFYEVFPKEITTVEYVTKEDL